MLRKRAILQFVVFLFLLGVIALYYLVLVFPASASSDPVYQEQQGSNWWFRDVFYSTSSYTSGFYFNTPNDVDFNRITASFKLADVSSGSCSFKAIVLDSQHNIIANLFSDSIALDNTNWVDVDMTSPEVISLTAGNDYWVFFYSQDNTTACDWLYIKTTYYVNNPDTALRYYDMDQDDIKWYSNQDSERVYFSMYNDVIPIASAGNDFFSISYPPVKGLFFYPVQCSNSPFPFRIAYTTEYHNSYYRIFLYKYDDVNSSTSTLIWDNHLNSLDLNQNGYFYVMDQITPTTTPDKYNFKVVLYSEPNTTVSSKILDTVWDKDFITYCVDSSASDYDDYPSASIVPTDYDTDDLGFGLVSILRDKIPFSYFFDIKNIVDNFTTSTSDTLDYSISPTSSSSFLFTIDIGKQLRGEGFIPSSVLENFRRIMVMGLVALWLLSMYRLLRFEIEKLGKF